MVHYIGSSFLNVPSFLYLRDGDISWRALGNIRFDIAYGGAFYAFVKAADFGLQMVPGNSQRSSTLEGR